VLMTAMTRGLKPHRIRAIREQLGIGRRTLQRWRRWWVTSFVNTRFWKAARARFMPSVCEGSLPQPLVERFGAESPGGLLRLLEFLAPLTSA
jgi:hypothetical protein